MTARPPLRLAGGDVALERRLPDGRVLARFLDRDGERTNFTSTAWPHELRGIGWHLAEIKRLIAGLPLQGATPVLQTQAPPLLLTEPTLIEPSTPRPRGFLHAHFAADRED